METPNLTVLKHAARFRTLKTLSDKVKARIGYHTSPILASLHLWTNFHNAYFRKVISFNRSEISFDGEVKPWFNYPAIEFLDSLELDGLQIFEWGCGNSTLYFNQRGLKTLSVEHIPEWARSVEAKTNGEVLVIQDPEIYVDALRLSKRSWNIVLIDGEKRGSCARAFIKFLENHDCQMLIFDNANWFPETTKFLCSKTNWIPLLMNGFAPLVEYPTQTLFLINPRFPFKLRDSGNIPLGAEEWNHPDDF